MVNNGLVYIAYDGDNAGKLVGRAILADDPVLLKEVSERINLGHEIVTKWVVSHGGEVISGGGDEGSFSIPPHALEHIDQLRGDYHFATNLTMTVGVGKSLSEAGKCLLVGKFRGKNIVVQYDPSIEEEIRQAQDRVKQGTASPVEMKLGEAYLKPEGNMAVENKEENTDDCPYCKDVGEDDSCPYCDEQDTTESTDNCPYCQDSDISDDEHSCPYCEELDSRKQNNAAPGDDHQVQPTDGPVVSEPTAESGEDYAGVALAAPELDKPKESERVKIGPASASIEGLDDQHDTPSNEALTVKDGVPVEDDSAAAPSDEFKETPEDILQQLDSDGSDSTSDDRSVNNVDNADMTNDDVSTEGAISRPEDFWSDVPGDMGLAEDDDSPDLGGVLQEDLDGQAENMKREKVVQMVSEALEGFKGCKEIIEKAKTQAPNLYQSSIAMLRAMIEMAEMLGLGQNDETAEEVIGEPNQEAAPAGAVPAPEGGDEAHDWQDPFPKHPDHGGEPKEGGPTDPKSIGQPLGKLPTKNTTPHVARTPMPPGGVNAKGQKKVIDPVTGKTRWINMKEGKVKSATGVPIKPPKDNRGNA